MMTDEEYMRICLREAEQAGARGEVPIGALVVRAGVVLARAGNRSTTARDPTAHAEIVALREAAIAADNYRLPGAEVFATVEPCMMCVGALLQARVHRVVFGCPDPKGGFLGSVADYSAEPLLNHRLVVRGGVCGEAAARLLREFFRERRS
jgi:tRNA(adenine34) deaminase